MPLNTGTRLGAYEILAPVGAGGMGEVYRARDTKLGREVAIKVLPDAFARDPERLARFEREAQVLASLNHPNIAAIYGLEEHNGSRYLVLEYVPGETLGERIGQSALPVDEALTVCQQIVAALQVAHDRGIVHRDLKPANVKITPEGKVKILDFGLAKDLAMASSSDISKSPTITTPAYTRAGMILGTAAYMSPEQARGKQVDKRTDVWAFGCVLYECLTGKQSYGGETITDVMAAIVKTDPDWNALPPETPSAVRRLLRRCLEKDMARRFRDIGDAWMAMEEESAAPAVAAAAAGGTPALPRRAWLPWAVAALAVLLAAGALLYQRVRPAALSRSQPVRRFFIPSPGTSNFSLAALSPILAMSPDGTRLVFAVNDSSPKLFLRRMDELAAAPIPGTEGGFAPFFSPDGQWIGFFGWGVLKKVPVTGGVPQTLVTSGMRGSATGGTATWAGDKIIFSPGVYEGLKWVPAAGGAPQALTTPDTTKGEPFHRWPVALPDGQTILFSAGDMSSSRILALSLKTGARRTVLENATYPQYASSGHLLFVRAGTLMAAPFDADRLEVTGNPVPILEGVAVSISGSAFTHIAMSSEGTLAYLPGSGFQSNRSLVWAERGDKVTTVPVAPQFFGNPRLSPDGTRLAIPVRGLNPDIWIYDLARGAFTRFTFEPGEDETPVWSPDGKRIAYAASHAGETRAIFVKSADGSGGEERLLSSENHTHVSSWSPDGRFLLYDEATPANRGDIWILPLEGERKPQPYVRTPFNEVDGRFSPDGHWVAYTSDETGRNEVYVQSFPAGSGKYQVSTEGGGEPVWARDGRTLFYREGEKLFSVGVETSGGFRLNKPELVLQGNYDSNPSFSFYDVTPDGRRFLFIRINAEQVSGQINVVTNWFDELRRLAPAGTK